MNSESAAEKNEVRIEDRQQTRENGSDAQNKLKGPKEDCVEIKCPSCEKLLTSIDGYLRHQVTHHPKDSKEKCRYSCNLCHYSSFAKDHVRKHLMRHYDIKPFKCPRCSWTCVTKYQLMTHNINYHMNLKRSYGRYGR